MTNEIEKFLNEVLPVNFDKGSDLRWARERDRKLIERAIISGRLSLGNGEKCKHENYDKEGGFCNDCNFPSNVKMVKAPSKSVGEGCICSKVKGKEYCPAHKSESLPSYGEIMCWLDGASWDNQEELAKAIETFLKERQ